MEALAASLTSIVFMICLTSMFRLKLHLRHQEEIAKKNHKDPVDLGPLQSEIEKMKQDHERIEKLAEETKKMLSNANLARATGMIGGHR